MRAKGKLTKLRITLTTHSLRYGRICYGSVKFRILGLKTVLSIYIEEASYFDSKQFKEWQTYCH